MAIITRVWGRDEPGPLQPFGGVVEVGMRLFRMSGHVVLPTKPLTTVACHVTLKQRKMVTFVYNADS